MHVCMRVYARVCVCVRNSSNIYLLIKYNFLLCMYLCVPPNPTVCVWMCVTHHSHSFRSPRLSLLLSGWFLYFPDAGSLPSPHVHTYTPLHPGLLHILSLRMMEKNRPWANCLHARDHLNCGAPFTNSNTAPANQHVEPDQRLIQE